MNRFFFFCKGYVIIKLPEESAERFLNLCKARGMEITDVLLISSHVYCKMLSGNYLKLKPIAEKTRCFPKMEKKAGFPFFLRDARRRKGIFIGCLFGLLLLSQCSQRIWHIDVKGGFIHTRQQMVQVLKEELQIYGGIGKNEVDCVEIEKKIRLLYQEIGWVSVERRGCNLYIRLNESTMPTLPEKTEQVCHIIAERDGRVSAVEVKSGTAMVKKGDVVKKGDILISGIVSILGDYEELIEEKVVGAQGKVWLESDFSYHAVYSMQYEQKIEEKSRYGLGVFFGERKIFSYIPSYSEGKYDIITSDIVPFVFEDYQVPFCIRIYRVNKYHTETETRTEAAVKSRAEREYIRFLEDLQAQNIQVAESSFETDISEKTCDAYGSGRLCGNFISYREIQEEESEDEHYGNNP